MFVKNVNMEITIFQINIANVILITNTNLISRKPGLSKINTMPFNRHGQNCRYFLLKKGLSVSIT